MVNLRLKKANLLGFNTYADFALDDRMAKPMRTSTISSIGYGPMRYLVQKKK